MLYDMIYMTFQIFRHISAKTFTSSTAVGKVFAASCELYILQTKCSKKSKNQVQKILCDGSKVNFNSHNIRLIVSIVSYFI